MTSRSKLISGAFKGFECEILESTESGVRVRVSVFGLPKDIEVLPSELLATPPEIVRRAEGSLRADSARWIDLECYRWWRERAEGEASEAHDRDDFASFFRALREREAEALARREADFAAWAPSVPCERIDDEMRALGPKYLPARNHLRLMEERYRELRRDDPAEFGRELDRFAASNLRGKQRRDRTGPHEWTPEE